MTMKLTNARIGLWLAVGALFACAGLLSASQADAAGSVNLSMDSITISAGDETTLDVEASNIPAPGLGAWTIGIVYDPAVLTVRSCTTGVPGSACNAAFAANRVTLAGAAANGPIGTAVLASITFACDAPGASDLSFIVTHLADSTIGGPQPLSFKLHSGRVTCSDAGSQLLGDVDCNGIVNSRDALLVLQFEANLISSLPCQERGDVDGNGRIDSVDAGLIKQIDAGLLIR